MKEARDAVHNALIRNDITVVTFKWVKYVSDFVKMPKNTFLQFEKLLGPLIRGSTKVYTVWAQGFFC